MDWTLDELVRRAGEALSAQDVRVPNGRVTPLPDRRVVRWYATIGLVDRPVAYRGRTALYGPRHLLQVVAVKRRQAEGRSLAEIQAELAGATDNTLREVAQLDLPRDLAVVSPDKGDMSPLSGDTTARSRFWAAEMVYGVVLHPGVTLTLPGQPGADDLTEIRAAARPLLDLLARRGLLRRRLDEGG